MDHAIDLNCDLGEGAGQDAALMPLISSANIACGAHAGDAATIAATVGLAQEHGVAIGAHPGFPDRENFGRRERAITGRAAAELVTTQVEILEKAAGQDLRHVKLHGALYNQVSRDESLATAVAEELARRWPGLILFALAGSPLARIARSAGLSVAEEVFADRSYQRDGTLTPRSQRGAMVESEDEAVAQVLRMVREGIVRSIDGTPVPVRAHTVCLHGDGPHAVGFAIRLRAALTEAGVAIRPARAADLRK